jgi:hypothetical protein
MIEQHHHRFYPGLRGGQGDVSGASLKFLQFVSRVKTPMPEELQQLINYYREHREELALAERSASAHRMELNLWGARHASLCRSRVQVGRPLPGGPAFPPKQRHEVGQGVGSDQTKIRPRSRASLIEEFPVVTE